MTKHALVDDLLGPEITRDPYPYFAALREHSPVHYSEAHRAWLVTRYDDNVAAFADPALSSDRVRPVLAKMAPAKRAAAGPVFEMMADWMVVSDPPAHTRLRKLATVAFHPKKFVAMEGRIRELVDRYIDDYVASGQHGPDRELLVPAAGDGHLRADRRPGLGRREDQDVVGGPLAGGVRRRRRGARRPPRAGQPRPGGDARLLRGPARAREGATPRATT